MDDQFCSAFFVVGHTYEKDNANAKVVEKEVHFIVPSTNTKLEISGHEHVAKIPCYVNTMKIIHGDDLLYYKEKEKEVATSHEPKSLHVSMAKEPASKRQKK